MESPSQPPARADDSYSQKVTCGGVAACGICLPHAALEEESVNTPIVSLSSQALLEISSTSSQSTQFISFRKQQKITETMDCLVLPGFPMGFKNPQSKGGTRNERNP
jgi:hypothetical protein